MKALHIYIVAYLALLGTNIAVLIQLNRAKEPKIVVSYENIEKSRARQDSARRAGDEVIASIDSLGVDSIAAVLARYRRDKDNTGR